MLDVADAVCQGEGPPRFGVISCPLSGGRPRRAREDRACPCPGTDRTAPPTGRNMAGARALWRATGMTDDDFEKPIVAIANCFTQFVPGHVHLQRRRPARRRGDRRRAGGGGQGVQHHRRRRRHRHGPRRHALLPALPRPDRRLRRVHGQRALRRRPGLHLELRQDHAGHADGRDAPQHPDDLRLRRARWRRARPRWRRHRAPSSTSSTRWSRPADDDVERRGAAGRSSARPARPAARARACSPPTR